MIKNNMYGLTKNNIQSVDAKLERQEWFLHQNEFYNSSYSANIRPDKYIAELFNRVNTINKYSKQKDLGSIFITMTASSPYHPTKGLYKKGRYIKTIKNPIYNNSSPHDTSLHLSKIWREFLNTSTLRDYIPKDNRHYFKTYEPHKDGTPHMHALLYIPRNMIERVQKAFIKKMEKYGIKQYKFLYKFEKQKNYKDDNACAVAYIIKYINKTFKNAKSGKMSKEAYWFSFNRINRFTSSRSLVPLGMYRKICFRKECQDMLEMTDAYKRGALIYSNCKDVYLMHYDHEEGEVIDTPLFIKNPMYEAPKIQRQSFYTRNNEPKVEKEIQKKPIPVYKDGVYTHLIINGKLTPKPQIPVSRQSIQELLTNFYKLDSNIENINLQKYGVYKNEMIKRGLLSGKIQSVNDFNTKFNTKELL